MDFEHSLSTVASHDYSCNADIIRLKELHEMRPCSTEGVHSLVKEMRCTRHDSIPLDGQVRICNVNIKVMHIEHGMGPIYVKWLDDCTPVPSEFQGKVVPVNVVSSQLRACFRIGDIARIIKVCVQQNNEGLQLSVGQNLKVQSVQKISRKCTMPPTHIELFSGIGGFKQATDILGFHTAVANDHCDEAAAVYSETFGVDICDSKTLYIPHEAVACMPLIDKQWWSWVGSNAVDVVSAGFPCPSFSHIGARKGLVNDERGAACLDMILYIWATQPKMVALENVPGFRTHEHYQLVVNLFKIAGYRIFDSISSTKEHSAIHRKRWLAIAVRTSFPLNDQMISTLNYPICSQKTFNLHSFGSWWYQMPHRERAKLIWSQTTKDRIFDERFMPPGMREESRIYGPFSNIPTVTASYTYSYKFDDNYLEDRSLYTFGVTDSEILKQFPNEPGITDKRFLHPFEVASALGHTAGLVLYDDVDESMRLVGNSISPIHAACVMVKIAQLLDCNRNRFCPESIVQEVWRRKLYLDQYPHVLQKRCFIKVTHNHPEIPIQDPIQPDESSTGMSPISPIPETSSSIWFRAFDSTVKKLNFDDEMQGITSESQCVNAHAVISDSSDSSTSALCPAAEGAIDADDAALRDCDRTPGVPPVSGDVGGTSLSVSMFVRGQQDITPTEIDQETDFELSPTVPFLADVLVTVRYVNGKRAWQGFVKCNSDVGCVVDVVAREIPTCPSKIRLLNHGRRAIPGFMKVTHDSPNFSLVLELSGGGKGRNPASSAAPVLKNAPWETTPLQDGLTIQCAEELAFDDMLDSYEPATVSNISASEIVQGATGVAFTTRNTAVEKINAEVSSQEPLAILVPGWCAHELKTRTHNRLNTAQIAVTVFDPLLDKAEIKATTLVNLGFPQIVQRPTVSAVDVEVKPSVFLIAELYKDSCSKSVWNSLATDESVFKAAVAKQIKGALQGGSDDEVIIQKVRKHENSIMTRVRVPEDLKLSIYKTSGAKGSPIVFKRAREKSDLGDPEEDIATLKLNAVSIEEADQLSSALPGRLGIFSVLDGVIIRFEPDKIGTARKQLLKGDPKYCDSNVDVVGRLLFELQGFRNGATFRVVTDTCAAMSWNVVPVRIHGSKSAIFIKVIVAADIPPPCNKLPIQGGNILVSAIPWRTTSQSTHTVGTAPASFDSSSPQSSGAAASPSPFAAATATSNVSSPTASTASTPNTSVSTAQASAAAAKKPFIDLFATQISSGNSHLNTRVTALEETVKSLSVKQEQMAVNQQELGTQINSLANQNATATQSILQELRAMREQMHGSNGPQSPVRKVGRA
eukprot:TRINITY_DN27478_c0_g1_i1.p1 TRINITY_DN27478_c0_g1~~TRINITY_DN27478_c0_g1_i1.p1  ORF type:complete len:1319 (-),score=200.87 TRINITY_DN27478_c0_g1_i1:1304-5260(-)